MADGKGARIRLGVLSVIITIIGLVFIVAGLWLKYESGLLTLLVIKLFNNIEYNNIKLGYMLLAIAAGMTTIGFLMLTAMVLGMCGSCTRNRICICFYVALVTLVVILQISLMSGMVAFHSKTDTWLRGKMLSLLKSYDGPQAADDISEGWNSLFRHAKCCAVNDQFSSGNSTNDFTAINATWSSGNHSVPATCCQGVEIDTVPYYESNPSECTEGPSNYYSMGCWDKTKQMSWIYLFMIGIGCFIAIVAEVFSIVAGCKAADKTKPRVAPE